MEQASENRARSDANELLGQRYTILAELGRGSQGKLFVAEDHESGEKVAVKELDLKLVDEWKAIELFEREADALEGLDHPGIPAYVDTFHQRDEDGAERFFLVQEYIEGTPLSAKLDAVELKDEAAARQFLHEMLSILAYMHSLNPPVVHRDIKPSNIIVRPDGSHALVDFGAVQTILPETVGGSTVVGTTGYMPPEQLMGRATPASDVYALGATVVHAMTGIEPADFEMVRMKLDFKGAVEASDAFIELLEHMLEPSVDKRLADADAVVEAMHHPAGLVRNTPRAAVQTSGSSGGELVAWKPTEQRIAELESRPPRAPMSLIHAGPERLTIEVGPISPPARNFFWMPVILMGLAILVGALTGGCLLVVTIPVALWLIFKGRRYLRPASERLELTAERLVIERVEHRRFGAPKITSETFATDELYLPHVHRVSAGDNRRGSAMNRQAEGDVLSSSVGMPGLIFTTRDGETAPFGALVLNRHRFTQIGLHDDEGELDWLDDIVTEYMKYLRGGTSDD